MALNIDAICGWTMPAVLFLLPAGEDNTSHPYIFWAVYSVLCLFNVRVLAQYETFTSRTTVFVYLFSF